MLTIQLGYHEYIKADPFLGGHFLGLPTLSAALMGLIVSALARTQTQTLLISSVYFLGLLLLSSFLYPLEGSAELIQRVSHFFAFTYVVDPSNAWIFGGDFKRELGEPLLFLAAQCVIYGFIAWLACRWQRRKI